MNTVKLQDIKDFFAAVSSADSVDKVKALVAKGVDVNTIDNNKRNALFYMRLRNNSTFNNELFSFFRSMGININQPDINNKNALMHCKKPCFEAVKAFINAGLNIEKTDNDGNTLLFYVRDVKSVRFLIDKIANVNHVNKKGQNALYAHLSYKHSTYSLIALINAGAKVDDSLFDLDHTWYNRFVKMLVVSIETDLVHRIEVKHILEYIRHAPDVFRAALALLSYNKDCNKQVVDVINNYLTTGEVELRDVDEYISRTCNIDI